MSKLLSYLRWLIIGGAALCLVLAVVVALYTRTEHFRRLVQDQLIGAINESIRGSVSLERIEGTLWGDVNLYNLRARYQDGEIAHLPRVTISFSWRALIRGQLQVSRVEAVEPAVRLQRDGAGRWNLVEAFSSGSEEPAGIVIALQEIIVRQAKIDVALVGGEPQKYHLTGVDLKGRLTMAPAGLSVDLREVSARLGIPEMTELSIQGALSYQDTSSLPSLTLTDWQITSAASRIKLSGRVQDLDKPQLQVKAALEKLAAADLKRFVPDWPLKHEITGAIDLSGALAALKTNINLGAGDARLSGRLDLNLAQETPQFQGTFKVVGLDAREFFELEELAGVVSGDIEVKGRGAALGAMEAAGSLNVRALQAGGWTLGNAIVNVQLRQRAVSLDGKLKGELGGADWRGQITLDQVPRYAMDIAVRDLDVQRVSPEGGATGGRLNFNGRIKGAGLKIADMNTLAEIEILPSSVGPVKVQQGAVRASLAGGRIRVTRGTLRTADTTVAVKGDIGTDLEQRGTLDYEVQAKDLSSWLSLVGQKGSGSVALKGRAQGNLTTLKTEGTAKLKGLNFAGAAVNDGTIAFDLARAGAQSLPAGTVRADLSGVQSGIRLRKVDASVKLAPDGPSMIHFDAKAQDERNRAHALSGDIGWQTSAVNARLSNLSLQLPDGVWKLAQPATIKKRGDEFLFENVTLRNGAKGFTIDGSAGLTGEQALSFRLQEFPLETLAELLPQLPKMTGILTVEAQVSGTALAPEITAAAELRDSTIGGQAYGGVVADLLYQKRQARMNLTVRQDASHTLSATGSLPLALSWQGGWRSEVNGPINAHIRSAGLSLAFLNAYSGKSLDEVGGKLTLDIRARGSFKEPELSGTFRVLDGKLKATPLGVNVTDIAAEGTLAPRAVNILSLSARAAEGSLNGKGVLALKDNALDNFKLSLAAKRWPAINTRRYQAQIQGNVDLNGSLTAPKVTGAIEIVEANLRPDLAFLQKSATAVKRDNTIVIVKGTDPVAVRKKDGETENFTESMLFKQTSLDIVLRMPGNFWIRHPDGVVELRGNYRLVKQTNTPLDVTGAAEIVRGWVAFQGRRFDLTRGRIEFTGGDKINPALDIVALRRLPQYQVEALVGGTAESPTLTLRSQPHLDQADIVALLLFGKPTKDLNRGEQVSLQQSASALASGYLAGTVINSISEAIGLDRLGVEFANVDVNNDKVGIGSYIGRNTYVSVSEELAGEKGREVKVEYQIAPEWKIGTSTDSSGSSGVDLIWSKQY